MRGPPRTIFALLIASVILVALAARAPQRTEGLRAEGPDGFPPPTCANIDREEVYLSKPPPVINDLYFTGMDLNIQAVAQVFRAVPYPALGTCLPKFMDVPDASWQLASKPPGSTANIQKIDNFHARLRTDVEGQYTIRFTACPNTCLIQIPDLPFFTLQPIVAETSLTAADELAFPPRQMPVVPDLSGQCNPGSNVPPPTEDHPPTVIGDPCTPTQFSAGYVDWVCAGEGGIVDPQWVTARNWHGPGDYELLEGEVEKSRVSRKDSPINHYSQDANVNILADLPFRYILSSSPENANDPYVIEAEWETDEFPEKYRPTAGDRVSVFGYWIHDCDHGYTEIHPPVGIAVHRPRPVRIPFSEGLGDSVYVPGVVSDVYFSSDGGQATSDCTDTGLHQPGAGNETFATDKCVPVADTGGPNPLGRSYTYRIYLPPNPADMLKEQGHPNPPQVNLYYRAEGSGILPAVNPVTTADGFTYLEVTIDLSQPGIETYTGRVSAAWKYPAPDNWGLKSYQLTLDNLDVRDDADNTSALLEWAGDWRLWMNIRNVEQEWTQVINCDDCIYDDTIVDFDGVPWHTGSGICCGNSLGLNVLMFPEQLIAIYVTGFEDDGVETGDDIGTISLLVPQPNETKYVYAANHCTESYDLTIPVVDIDLVGAGCAHYFAQFRVIPQGDYTPALSLAAQALYEDAKVDAGDIGGCLHEAKAFCFDEAVLWLDGWHPNGNHPAGPKDLGDVATFESQAIEDTVWTEATPDHLKDILGSAPQGKLDRVLEELHAKLLTGLRGDHMPWELLLLEAVLPPGEWDQHFSDIQFDRPLWGDIDCNGVVNAVDALQELRLGAGVTRHAPCFNIGDVNCDGDYGALDALRALRYVAGLPPLPPAAPNPLPIPFPNGATAAPSSDCRVIGEEIFLTVEGSGATPTPTPTLTPTPTPTVTPVSSATPTPTPTPTPTVTPTPVPTPTPSPTPDTTGPAITNLGANPDGSPGNEIYDFHNVAFPASCNPNYTTISATVSDPSGVAYLKLFYRFTGGAEPTSEWFQAGLEPNGDTLFAVIFPQDRTGNSTLQWYWEAQDLNGYTSVAPSSEYYDVPITDCFIIT